MTTAGAVAVELRRLADALDKGADTPIKQPYLNFLPDTREEFLGITRLLPKPLYKSINSSERYELKTYLSWGDTTVYTQVLINRDKVCKLVKPAQPAEYEEEDALTDAPEGSLAAVAPGFATV
jgi:hypothetical protein